MLLIPRISEDETYAVAAPLEDGGYIIIQTYHNLEQLETGYNDWRNLSKERGLSNPLPVELSPKGDNFRILTELVKSP